MLLEIKNLHAGYGDHEVLRGVSLTVAQGEAVTLIGPNGAGKSTILKSVMGLTKKTHGQILWQMQDIGKLPTHALLEEGIGFVPQGRLVFPSLSVLENLEMGGYLIRSKISAKGGSASGGKDQKSKFKPAEILQENLENVLGRFPALKHKLKQKAGSLSGGEQQMLAVGRSLMLSPKLLMLDEPSLGLSPKITAEVFEKLKEINAGGTALLIVEQNVRLVLRHVDRGYLLAAGEIRFAGTAEELSSEKLMHEAFLV